MTFSFSFISSFIAIRPIMKFPINIVLVIIFFFLPTYLKAEICPKCITIRDDGIHTRPGGTPNSCVCSTKAPYGNTFLTKVTYDTPKSIYCCHDTGHCPTCLGHTSDDCSCEPGSRAGTKRHTGIFSPAKTKCCTYRIPLPKPWTLLLHLQCWFAHMKYE